MPTYSTHGYPGDPDDEDDEDDADEDDAGDSRPGDHLRPSELPNPADVDDPADDDDTAVPCPYCGKPVYEFADVCPHCRSFVSLDAGDPRKPRWLLITVALLVAVLAYGFLRGVRWF